MSSERGWKDLGRILERDTLRPRNRRGQRTQERRTVVVDLPSQQHRVVLVHGVMAVLHEHAAEVAELHRDRHGAAGMQAIHVLPPLLSGWNVGCASVPRQNLPLLEMDVNGMIPAAAAVLQRPDFTRAEFR